MMSDKTIRVLESQLNKFVECSIQYQSANDKFLRQFRVLLDHYKALKYEHESQRASRALPANGVRHPILEGFFVAHSTDGRLGR